jgi:hypothetical protein
MRTILGATILGAMAVVAALGATDASAQGVNLTGRWQCVAMCAGPPGASAFITQNGWELNIVTDAGLSSRAWVNNPGRIWIDATQEGAVYSPEGLGLQFDHGAVWQRAVDLQFEPAPLPRRR